MFEPGARQSRLEMKCNVFAALRMWCTVKSQVVVQHSVAAGHGQLAILFVNYVFRSK